MKIFSKISDGILALLFTIALYTLLYLTAFMSPGDEMNNDIIALATFVSITIFINFPLCWWIVKRIIKANRNNK